MDIELKKIIEILHENYDVLRTYKSHERYYRRREVECAYQMIIDVSLGFIKKWRLVISDKVIDCLSDIIKSCLYVCDELLDCGYNNLKHIERCTNVLEKIEKEMKND